MSFIETKLQVVETFATGETVKKSGLRTVYEKKLLGTGTKTRQKM